MKLFVFDEKYSVGINRLDQQHEKLFDLINELHQAMRQSKGKDVLDMILRDLEKYARNHFSVEEDYMVRFKYPDTTKHVAAHVKFIMKVADFKQDLKSGKPAVSVNVMNFLRDWLAKHILVVDKKYSDCFREHGLK